jgi:hypothetical protein
MAPINRSRVRFIAAPQNQITTIQLTAHAEVRGKTTEPHGGERTLPTPGGRIRLHTVERRLFILLSRFFLAVPAAPGLCLAHGESATVPYCEIELATEEKTLLALEPMSRIVPTTITKITASMTAYSAMSCPVSSCQNLRRRLLISRPPREFWVE